MSYIIGVHFTRKSLTHIIRTQYGRSVGTCIKYNIRRRRVSHSLTHTEHRHTYIRTNNHTSSSANFIGNAISIQCSLSVQCSV